jgi:hypothetical protein
MKMSGIPQENRSFLAISPVLPARKNQAKAISPAPLDFAAFVSNFFLIHRFFVGLHNFKS